MLLPQTFNKTPYYVEIIKEGKAKENLTEVLSVWSPEWPRKAIRRKGLASSNQDLFLLSAYRCSWLWYNRPSEFDSITHPQPQSPKRIPGIRSLIQFSICSLLFRSILLIDSQEKQQKTLVGRKNMFIPSYLLRRQEGLFLKSRPHFVQINKSF